jgi:hypothetical protein
MKSPLSRSQRPSPHKHHTIYNGITSARNIILFRLAVKKVLDFLATNSNKTWWNMQKICPYGDLCNAVNKIWWNVQFPPRFVWDKQLHHIGSSWRGTKEDIGVGGNWCSGGWLGRGHLGRIYLWPDLEYLDICSCRVCPLGLCVSSVLRH